MGQSEEGRAALAAFANVGILGQRRRRRADALSLEPAGRAGEWKAWGQRMLGIERERAKGG